MPLVYTGAPGCSFKPNSRKSSLEKHLRRRTWCLCKAVGWTTEKAVAGQVDGRCRLMEDADSLPPLQSSEPYVDASAVCRTEGKQCALFLSALATRAAVNVLAEELGCASANLVVHRSAGVMIHPRLLPVLQQWCAAARAARAGFVYVVTSDLLDAAKIGRWTGSLDALHGRYATYYGNVQLHHVSVDDCFLAEAELLYKFRGHHIRGELFAKQPLQEYIAALGQC